MPSGRDSGDHEGLRRKQSAVPSLLTPLRGSQISSPTPSPYKQTREAGYCTDHSGRSKYGLVEGNKDYSSYERDHSEHETEYLTTRL